ncbi:MAG: competence/damage-inducible protein A [Kiritimatiellae bacterium]|nr:competence/damage-inducible protein A [Kiritimatiellia bacterium]
MKPVVELITTGSELLSGRTVNRHAQVLGAHLDRLGFQLIRDTTVPDDLPAIRDVLKWALTRVDVVIVSGGLGPTSDDMTPEAVAGLFGRSVVVDAGSLEALRRRYERLGRAVTPAAERQARIVEKSVALPNPVGVAPGERLEVGGKTVFILPGPPAEFLAILEQHVLPWLDAALSDRPAPTQSLLMVCGLGESDIASVFEQAHFPPAGLQTAYCAAPGRIEVRFSAESTAGDPEAAAREAARLLGGHVYSVRREDLEEVVGRLLTLQSRTLAVAESCTGGLVGARITAVSGSSAYFRGGVIVYANDMKTAELGVPADLIDGKGAVSPKVAAHMARAVAAKFKSDYGLSITGIAGPTGGTPDKPVGLVYIALAEKDRVQVRRYRFGGDRERIREWSVRMALDMLRRRLQDVPETDDFGTDCTQD